MAGKTFKAKIKLKSGHQDVTVVADNFLKAKDMLEAQYGKGSVLGPVTQVQK